MPSGDVIIQSIVSGVAAGSVYGLIGLGFSLAYRTTNILNFAQGDLVALGGYLVYALTTAGVPLAPAVAISLIVVGAGNSVVERLLLRPLYKQPLAYPILSTVGLSLVIETIIRLKGGASPLFPERVLPTGTVDIGSVTISIYDIGIIVVSTVIAIGAVMFVNGTRLGLGMRTVAQDSETSVMLGMNPKVLFPVAFALSGVIAAAAGVLIGPQLSLTPTMGLSLSIAGFSAAVLGGLGSMTGAMVGGVAIGVIQNMSVLFIDPGYEAACAYVVLILVLVIRPSGIFGERLLSARGV